MEELDAGTRDETKRTQQAVVKQLKADLADLKIDLDRSVLRAPFDGTISAKLVDPGVMVSPQTVICELVSDSLEAWIGVPESVAAKLSPTVNPASNENTLQLMKPTKLTLSVGGKQFQAFVKSRLPRLNGMS